MSPKARKKASPKKKPAKQGWAPQRTAEVFAATVRADFAFLKATKALDELYAKALPLKGGLGFLVPACELHTQDQALIEKLAKWRAENAFAYPTQFPVTLAGTAKWLRSRVLDVEDRILFLVVDALGNAVGHLGYANSLGPDRSMEIDNVVRGVGGVAPGIMAAAMEALLKWAEENFLPSEIYLRVMDDNPHAIAFYRKLGFQDDRRLPLRKTVSGETINYGPVPEGDTNPPDKHFLRMVYRPKAWDGKEMILTAGPLITARESWYALDAARTGWNKQWSAYLKKFEAAFGQYLGTQYALTTSSGTGALHIALLALGIGPGDEVIVPDLTWVATANAVVYAGATPIFADVEPDTWCLDPASAEARITRRTRAIIPVHLYGHPARMDKIMAIARRHKLYVVEDAAPAIGATCRGKRVGTFGDIGCFSFQGAKLLVTGEGGMIVSDNKKLFDRVTSFWDQGRDLHRQFWINEVGVKYKMAGIQAAIGLGQLEHVDSMVEAKRRIFGWYAEGLAGVPHIRLTFEAPWAHSIYWMSSVLVEDDSPLTRDQLREALRARNIDTRPVFPAISQYPIWKKRQKPQPNAKRIGDQGINLPSGVCLKREQVDYVCRAIREILRA
jgi:perosamine synthetase